jgi:2-iminobutanoate/2-iminopropanoate deaminase
MSTPVGPYTPFVAFGDLAVTSGQIGLGPDGLADGFSAQMRQAMANLVAVVESGGATLDDVVKTTVFLADMADYSEMNDLYLEAFGDHRPARSAVAVSALPIGALVEIEAWLVTPGRQG